MKNQPFEHCEGLTPFLSDLQLAGIVLAPTIQVFFGPSLTRVRGEGGLVLDKVGGVWEFAHVSSIVTCDSRRRLIIADAVPGQDYLVDGLHVEPAPVKRANPRQPREWAGPKHSLAWHMKQLREAGLKFEPITNKEKVGPCPFSNT